MVFSAPISTVPLFPFEASERWPQRTDPKRTPPPRHFLVSDPGGFMTCLPLFQFCPTVRPHPCKFESLIKTPRSCEPTEPSKVLARTMYRPNAALSPECSNDPLELADAYAQSAF